MTSLLCNLSMTKLEGPVFSNILCCGLNFWQFSETMRDGNNMNDDRAIALIIYLENNYMWDLTYYLNYIWLNQSILF